MFEIAPSFPLNLMVVDQDLMSLGVTWNTPQSPNGIITHYTVSTVINSVEIMAILITFSGEI